MIIVIVTWYFTDFTGNVYHHAWFQVNWTNYMLVKWCIRPRLWEEGEGDHYSLRNFKKISTRSTPLKTEYQASVDKIL